MLVRLRRNAERSLKLWTLFRGRLFGYYEWIDAYDPESKAAHLK